MRIRSLVLMLVLAMGGCKPDYPNCRNDDDRRKEPKEYCVQGKCQQCRNDQDCPEGQKCAGGKCQAQACTDDSQCPPGQSCIGGQCAPCQSDTECGPGGKCQGGKCLRAKKCSSDSDCAQDEECKGGVCVSGRPRQGGAGPCALDPIFFDFNESSVTTEGAATIQRNSECLKKEAARSVLLTGHTDPRGTDEYNLALGDRRAQSVRSYLERLGVAPGRLKTLSRGEIDASGT